MAKWNAVILGFILTLAIYLFFGDAELIGLLIVGFIVGYMAHDGILGGLWNAALAGAFGSIVAVILFIITITIGSTALIGLFGGLAGFTFSGIGSLIVVILNIIHYAIVMGITGAVGGAIANKRD